MTSLTLNDILLVNLSKTCTTQVLVTDVHFAQNKHRNFANFTQGTNVKVAIVLQDIPSARGPCADG